MGRGSTGRSTGGGLKGRGPQAAAVRQNINKMPADQADRVLREDFKDWADNLSSDAKSAITSYTSFQKQWGEDFNYQYINRNLAYGRDLPTPIEAPTTMNGMYGFWDGAKNAYFGGRPSPKGNWVTSTSRDIVDQKYKRLIGDRDFSLTPQKAVQALQSAFNGKTKREMATFRGTIEPKLLTAKVGDIIEEKRVISSTLDRRAALDYAKDRSGIRRTPPAVIVMEHPVGTKGGYTDVVAGGQKEFVQFAPKFVVTKIREYPSGGKVIYTRTVE
jgi:hypothetical protein